MAALACLSRTAIIPRGWACQAATKAYTCLPRAPLRAMSSFKLNFRDLDDDDDEPAVHTIDLNMLINGVSSEVATPKAEELTQSTKKGLLGTSICTTDDLAGRCTHASVELKGCLVRLNREDMPASDILAHLDQAVAMTTHLRGLAGVAESHADPAWRTAAKDAMQATNTDISSMWTSEHLRGIASKVLVEQDHLDEEDRFVASTLQLGSQAFDTEDISDEQKNERALAASGMKYVQEDCQKNLQDMSVAVDFDDNELPGIPAEEWTSIFEAHPTRSNCWQLHVNAQNNESIRPLLSRLTDADVRARLYKALRSHEENTRLMTRSMAIAQTVADQLGHPSYAHFQNQRNMEPDPTATAAMLMDVLSTVKPLAQRQYDDLLRLKQEEQADATAVLPSDLPYLTQKSLKERGVPPVPTGRYLTVSNIFRGFSTLCEHAFGVRMRAVPLEQGEWLSDCSTPVHRFDFEDEDGSHLGVVYFDLFARAGKPTVLHCISVQQRRVKLDGSVQPSVSVITNNLPYDDSDPDPNMPASGLLELLHEFGHGLHNLLIERKHSLMSSIHCAPDFAEIPSCLMERAAHDIRFLSCFAFDEDMGRFLSREAFQNILTHISTARALQAHDMFAEALVEHLMYSPLDLRRELLPNSGTLDLEDAHELRLAVQQQHMIVQQPDDWYTVGTVQAGTKMLPYAYGAVYGAHIYSKLFSEDLLDRQPGRLLRVMLARGAMNPRTTIRNVLNGRVSTDALLRELEFGPGVHGGVTVTGH